MPEIARSRLEFPSREKMMGWALTRWRALTRYSTVYIYVRSCHQKKIVTERTRDLIYLKFVATDFFPKIISPSAGENSGDLSVALAILQFLPC